MPLSYIKQSSNVYQKLIFCVLAFMLPFVANSTTEEVINEKRTEVAMRMIGHEVLMCVGDRTSRVMPIEKIDGRYIIPFEFEFGFDPEDIIAITEGVMHETGVAFNYLVEVEQCETKEVVYVYEIRRTAYSEVLHCKGRNLPEDCYRILVTILDDISSAEQLIAAASDSTSMQLTYSEPKESNLFKSAFVVVPLFFLIGFILYIIKKRNPEDIDPNLIMIGASQFDKRNMALSFKNESVELSHKEAELLSLLHTSANSPVEREEILKRVWGDEGDYVGRTLDVFISKLRKKLESDSSVKIVNIRGIGYKLVMGARK
jgi:preprotein translocase subunit SecG